MKTSLWVQYFFNFLIVVHTGLACWALIGFSELFFVNVPWSRLSNPLFSNSMLLLQWSSILVASIIFIAGCFNKWNRLPQAMTVCYVSMALICAYQTFFILQHDSRYREMGIEYIEYIVILIFLYRNSK